MSNVINANALLHFSKKKNVKNKDKYQNCSNLNTNRKKETIKYPFDHFEKTIRVEINII